MDRLAFTSLKSVTEERVRREMLTNELANITSVGFKKSFESATRTIKVQGPGFDSRLMPVLEQRDEINLAPGVRMVTGRKLDIAIDGSGVLGVRAKNGELAFTRRGDLHVNSEGLLETGGGQAVLGENAAPINVPVGLDLEISQDGTIWARDPNVGEQAAVQVGRLLLRDASATSLGRREDGLFKPIGDRALPNGDFQSGPVPVSVSAGAIEGSNVSPIEAMVRMLDQTRSFETQIRIIKETRGLDESGAGMLRAR
jgi:flagellar basal-body rod protein FlgF